MIDFTKLREKLDPDPGGEDQLRIRTGVVSVINADGTLDLLISGVAVPSVPRLANVTAAVNDTVQVITLRGGLLVIGQVAVNAGGLVSSRVATTVRTSNTSTFTAETLINTVTADLVIGRTYKVSWAFRWDSDVAGDTAFARIRDTNLAGTQLQNWRADSRLTNVVTSSGWGFRVEVEFTAVATGSKTFAATLARATGSGNLVVVASAAGPDYLYVDFVR